MHQRYWLPLVFKTYKITTTTVLWPFVKDYPGELVPGKNIHLLTPILIINHPLSTSSIYYNP